MQTDTDYIDLQEATTQNHAEEENAERGGLSFQADEVDKPGVVPELGFLQPGAVITIDALAKMFDRHPESVRRAVDRGELPPPVRLFGKKTWTVRALLQHLETRLGNAAQEREEMDARMASLDPDAGWRDN